MKKLLLLFMVAFVSMALFACGEKEFAVDGEFLAYEVSVHRNAPQVTFVTVTIEDGEIVGYTIDALQGRRTGGEDIIEDEVVTGKTPYVWSWNAQTKKELGDNYNMLPASEIGKEWYEQAAAIEAFWLENGIEAMTTNEEGYIDNVTGASVSDAYSAIALQAVENAKAGKFVSIYASGTDLYSAEMVVTPKGAIESLVIDTLQSTRSQEDGTFVWRELSKQDLGYGYRMHGQRDLTETDYIQWLEDNDKLEWFEQVALITDDIIENGWRTNAADNVPAGVSITTSGYYTLLARLFAFADEAVK
ncbi:MAG: hypothetical protein ACNA7K_05905 [Acholeplasmataceae bacterium]